jgi:hypothetical protein
VIQEKIKMASAGKILVIECIHGSRRCPKTNHPLLQRRISEQGNLSLSRKQTNIHDEPAPPLKL